MKLAGQEAITFFRCFLEKQTPQKYQHMLLRTTWNQWKSDERNLIGWFAKKNPKKTANDSGSDSHTD